jgi:uncharacterized membrane protein
LLSAGDGWLGIFESKKGLLLLIFLGAFAFAMPNTAQIFRFAQNEEKPALFVWRKSLLHAGILSVISVIAMFYINSENEFLYFQF